MKDSKEKQRKLRKNNGLKILVNSLEVSLNKNKIDYKDWKKLVKNLIKLNIDKDYSEVLIKKYAIILNNASVISFMTADDDHKYYELKRDLKSKIYFNEPNSKEIYIQALSGSLDNFRKVSNGYTISYLTWLFYFREFQKFLNVYDFKLVPEAKSILTEYANELVSAKVFVDNNIYISFYKKSLDDIKILKL